MQEVAHFGIYQSVIHVGKIQHPSLHTHTSLLVQQRETPEQLLVLAIAQVAMKWDVASKTLRICETLHQDQ